MLVTGYRATKQPLILAKIEPILTFIHSQITLVGKQSSDHCLHFANAVVFCAEEWALLSFVNTAAYQTVQAPLAH